uniref:Reverse transcriptase domain-containing protein n=1 Tax=Leptobrachium leishanense TaxID=445787 RepID=A0A8C5PLM2_9ANUR
MYKINRTLAIQNNVGETPFLPNTLRLRSVHDVKTNNSTIHTFTQQLHHIVDSTPRQRTFSNMSKKEWEALQDLARDPSIVVRPADKGGGIAVLDYQQYRSDILLQLGDLSTYRVLSHDPTLQTKARIDTLLIMGLQAGFIDHTIVKFCTVDYPVMPVLYTIPKLHKDPCSPPGRPIVSAMGSLLEPLGKYVVHVCKSSVMALPTCLRDTPQLLSKLHHFQLPSNPIILVTLDVRSLYTVIPHEGGINALIQTISESTCYNGPPIEFIRELLSITLHCNFFRFEKKIYLQLAGT